MTDSAAVADVVHRFHRALASGDSATAIRLLAPHATILESGSVETVAEYRGHHLPADIEFARALPGARGPMRVTVNGNAAWATSTSETQGTFKERAINSAGAEIMVLERFAGSWRIVAIHWSSRRRTPGAPATTPAPANAEAGRVVATIQALFAAAERHDLVALDSLYAGDSLTVVEGAGLNRGWVDYRDHHLAPELKEMKNFRYRPFEIEARVSGTTAWAMFRYALAATMGERAIDAVGRGTAILERQPNGQWRVRHTQTSSRARRPADPPMP